MLEGKPFFNTEKNFNFDKKKKILFSEKTHQTLNGLVNMTE